jgi:hypothetical protein
MMRVAAMTVLFAAIAARAWATTGSAAAADDRAGRAFFEQAETKFKDGRYEDALVD